VTSHPLSPLLIPKKTATYPVLASGLPQLPSSLSSDEEYGFLFLACLSCIAAVKGRAPLPCGEKGFFGVKDFRLEPVAGVELVE
jgi:hypothetical protein